ncbi:hypothetical protein [Escherichia coli]|uniref:hypothetical protein n=1 Tax=Escherichia coli TaxID=562 RepID=UPI0003784887|nr:hypothetical protein [Escherichia coli]
MPKESRTDRWLRTGFVLFIVVLLLLIVFNGTAKTSDVSNWIIAFANIAMAAAAVLEKKEFIRIVRSGKTILTIGSDNTIMIT